MGKKRENGENVCTVLHVRHGVFFFSVSSFRLQDERPSPASFQIQAEGTDTRFPLPYGSLWKNGSDMNWAAAEEEIVDLFFFNARLRPRVLLLCSSQRAALSRPLTASITRHGGTAQTGKAHTQGPSRGQGWYIPQRLKMDVKGEDREDAFFRGFIKDLQKYLTDSCRVVR